MRWKSMLLTLFVLGVLVVSVPNYTGASGQNLVQMQGQVYTTSASGTAAKTRVQCGSNTCAQDGGCASCIWLHAATKQMNAQVVAIRCKTNAEVDRDGPHGFSKVVDCTTDNAWSVFDQPVVENFGYGGMQVTTVFRNRSHDRDRDAILEVDWR